MTNIEKLISTAKAEVGYLEKATNAQLDSKTANAGSGNWTKYARDLDALGDFYNGKKNGYAWCDVFVDWCFYKTFGAETAKKLLCQPDKSAGASCTSSAGYYKAKGQLHTSGPQAGDQVFFTGDGGKTCSHTGLVIKVDGRKVYTIEGNTSGASGVIANGGGVCEKSYALGYAKIYGYGRPDWTLMGESTPGETTYTVVKGDTLTKIAAKHSSTVQKLADYNGIADPNKITVGQKLKIPMGGSTATTGEAKAEAARYKDAALARVYTVTATSGLHVRAGAGTDKASLGVLPKGTAVRCYGYYNKDSSGGVWLYVVANGITGYVSKEYLA